MGRYKSSGILTHYFVLLLYYSSNANMFFHIQALLNHPGGTELLDANDRYGHAPLHVAAAKGYMDCVKVCYMLIYNTDQS